MPTPPTLNATQKTGVDRAEIYDSPNGVTLALWVDTSPTLTFDFPTAAEARAWLDEQGALNRNAFAPGPAVITDRDVYWVEVTVEGKSSDFALITFNA